MTTCKNGHVGEGRVVRFRNGRSVYVCSGCRRIARAKVGRAAGPAPAVHPIEHLLRGRTITSTNCWIPRHKPNPNGYVQVVDRYNQRGRVYAHRLAYEYFVAPIPDGLTIDHLCRVRACFNPEHLEPVTQVENVLRGNSQPAIRYRMRAIRGTKPKNFRTKEIAR